MERSVIPHSAARNYYTTRKGENWVQEENRENREHLRRHGGTSTMADSKSGSDGRKRKNKERHPNFVFWALPEDWRCSYNYFSFMLAT